MGLYFLLHLRLGLLTSVSYCAAILLPSFATAVIVTLPNAFPVMIPFSSTVAILLLLLLHSILLSTAFSGFTSAVNCIVVPIPKHVLSLVILISSTNCPNTLVSSLSTFPFAFSTSTFTIYVFPSVNPLIV